MKYNLPHSTSTMAERVTREEVLRLMRQRDGIDENIRALGQILTSNHIGMTEPLVDREGFPRNDIDVYQVRHARHKIICLQNDFKTLTREIDAKLQVLHENLRRAGESGAPMDVAEHELEEEARPTIPIARVNHVSEGSPAYHAGLEVEDLIVTFGSLDSGNFQSINDIGTIVGHGRGSMISVTVKRGSSIVKLALIPGEWSGRGLLGCNVVPVENVDR